MLRAEVVIGRAREGLLPLLEALSRLDVRPYLAMLFVHVATAFLFLTNQASGQAAGLDSMPLDDSWIHLVYARSFALYGQFFYNPGEPEAGMTSPLWVVVVGASYRFLAPLGLDLPAVAKLVGLAFAFGVSVVAYRIAYLSTGWKLLATAVGILISVEPGFAFAKVSGMEVSLFAFLALTALLCYLRDRLFLTGLFLGLGVVARPEGVLLVAAVAGVHLFRLLWSRRQLTLVTEREVEEMALLLLPTAVLAGAWALHNLSVSGKPLPNTYYAKHQSLGFLNFENLGAIWLGYFRQSSFLRTPTFPATLALVAAGSVSLLIRWGFKGFPLAAFPWALYYGVALNQPFSATPWNFFARRYLDPALPFLAMLIVLGLAYTWSLFLQISALRARQTDEDSPLSVAATRGANLGLTALFLLLMVSPFVGLPALLRDYPGEYSWNARNVDEVDVAAALWVRANTPPEARIGTGDAGAMRYFSDRYIVDLVGLNYHKAVGRPAFDTAKEERLDYVVVFRSVYFDSWAEARLVHEVSTPRNTILGGSTMGIYQLDWENPPVSLGDKSQMYVVSTEGWRVIDRLDVGNPVDEEAHDYTVTEEGAVVARTFRTTDEVMLTDDARTYTGVETFVVESVPGQDLMIVKRYDAAVGGALRVFANGVEVGVWELEPHTYFFGESSFVIPGDFIRDDATELSFEFIPRPGRSMNSFYYWALVPEGATAP